MFPDIAHLSPTVWGILLAAAAALIVAVVLTCRASALSTRKLVTVAMLTAVYVVLSLVGTLNLWWIRISVDSLPIILGALLYGPVGGLLVGLLGSLMNQLITYELQEPKVAVNLVRQITKEILSLEQMPMRYRLYDEEPWQSQG